MWMVLFLRKIERDPGALLCAILRAARPWQELVTDALCAEAHACVAALNAVAEMGMQSIILETDSQILVKALTTEGHDRALGGVLFREAKFILATMFNSARSVLCSSYL